MIYLIDNQLPPGLVGHLQTHGLNTSHVSQCGLERASDGEIWNYGKSHDCVNGLARVTYAHRTDVLPP